MITYKIFFTLFISSTLQACVQKQSWTATKVIPFLNKKRKKIKKYKSSCYAYLWQCNAVSIMCVESRECTKFGGIAIFCSRTLGALVNSVCKTIMHSNILKDHSLSHLRGIVPNYCLKQSMNL